MDAMELRGMASQNPMVPSRDLTDPLGLSIMSYAEGDLSAVQSYVESTGKDAAVKEMEAKRWGPTRIPIFNVILQFLHYTPAHQQALLDLTSYLAHDLHVAVDGTDVTGASALYWSISTKPFAEPAFASILFSAGGSVNQKSRFGSTCASEIAQVDFSRPTAPAVEMLAWYVQHGGDVEGKDNDGMSVKMLVDMMKKRVPELDAVVRKGRGEREKGTCENCGREGRKGFKVCARCKGVRYCGEVCQRVDWKGHKGGCRAA
jgi:hypothetical protein